MRTRGHRDPVVQVIDESKKETVYTIRAQGESFTPKVFRSGTYTVRAIGPDGKTIKELTGLKAQKA